MKFFFIVIIFLAMVSCSHSVEQNFLIPNLNEEYQGSIAALPNENYTAKYLIVKGIVSDSIAVNFGNDGIPFFFIGNVNDTIQVDYYGENDVKFLYRPLRETKGSLNIVLGIN